MKVRQFGPVGGPLAGVEIHHMLISFGALLRHLRKLRGLTVERTQVWVLTDDHWAELRCKGHPIWIDSEFIDFDVRPGDGCPPEVFLEVVAHLEAYRPWAINRLMARLSERARRWKENAHEAGRASILGRKDRETGRPGPRQE